MTTSFPVSRTVTIPGVSATQVGELLVSTAGFTAVNPYRTTDPKLAIEPFGPAAGVGAGFRFAGKDGKGTQTITAVTPTSVEHAIDLGRMGRSSQRISAVGRGDGVEVTWTQTMLADSFVQKVVGRFAEKILGGSIETGLANVTRQLTSTSAA